jgi:hypothetical protein
VTRPSHESRFVDKMKRLIRPKELTGNRKLVWTSGIGSESSADDVAIVDGAADQCPRAGANDRAERLRATGSNDMTEHPATDAANDQAGGAVIASAVVTIVPAAVDAIASIQPAETITAIVTSVVPRWIPTIVACIVAVFTTVPAILTTIPAIFPPVATVLTPIPPVLPPVATVLAPIPPVLPSVPVFVAIPAIPVALGSHRCAGQADE